MPIPGINEWLHDIDVVPATAGYLDNIPGAVVIPYVERATKDNELDGLYRELKAYEARYKDAPDHYRRLVWIIPFHNHFGFVVIDPKTNEAVIGEPMNGGYESELQHVENVVKAAFKDINIIPNTTKIQHDGTMCGRLSPKICEYLCNAPSLSDAMKPENLKKNFGKFKNDNDAKNQLNEEIFRVKGEYEIKMNEFDVQLRNWIIHEFNLDPKKNAEEIDRAFDRLRKGIVEYKLTEQFLTMIQHEVNYREAIDTFKNKELNDIGFEKSEGPKITVTTELIKKFEDSAIRARRTRAIKNHLFDLLKTIPVPAKKLEIPKKTTESTATHSTKSEISSENSSYSTSRPRDSLTDENINFKKVKTYLEANLWNIDKIPQDSKQGPYRQATKDGQSFNIYVNKLSTQCNDDKEVFKTMLEVFKRMHGEEALPKIKITPPNNKSIQNLWQEALRETYPEKKDFSNVFVTKKSEEPAKKTSPDPTPTPSPLPAPGK